MKRFAVCMIMLTALYGSAAAGGARETITVATDPTFEPLEFTDEQGGLTGFSIDLIQAVAEAGDFDFELKQVSWDEIFGGLEREEYDAVLSSITILEERKQKMDFSIPYLREGQLIVVPADSTGIEDLNDLAGKTVATAFTSSIPFLKQAEKQYGIKARTYYPTLAKSLEDVAAGRVDAAMISFPTASAAQRLLCSIGYGKKLKIAGDLLTEEYMGIAVKKGNKQLLELINKSLEKVKVSGKLAELEEKWLR